MSLMESSPAYLFVYGTLLGTANEFAVYLAGHSLFYSNGRFEGLLYDLGWYPGAVYKPGCGQFVCGSIFGLKSTEETLKVLDEYEGFGADHPQPNEFVRALMDIETANGMVKCWVYLYNLPVGGLVQIVTGRYAGK